MHRAAFSYMSTRKVLKGASFLSGSEVINQGCALLRNIILARFLAKADFGIAALLGTILSVFEMTGKMALGQQVVQSKHADDPVFIDSVHFTQLALSSLSALLILAFAWPLAHFFAGSQYLVTIMSLSLIPFLNGFTNLNLYKHARQLNFGPIVLADVLPQICTTIAAWPLAAYLHDYRTILCLLVGKSLIYAVMTHLLAGGGFAPRHNAEFLKESLKFGWPLLLAGFIQIGNFQGDSMVIAANYSLAQLGEFSVALTMAMAPGLLLLKVCHSVSLPLLVEVQSDPVRLAERYGCYVELMALLSSFATLGMAFCGEQVIVLLFGVKYSGIGALACMLTAAQGLRIVRGATVGVAMACGDTLNNLLTSIWRLSGLLLAVVVGVLHGSITWFALTAVAGEIITLTVSVARLKSLHSIKPRATLLPVALAACCVLGALSVKWMLSVPVLSWMNWPMLILALVLNTSLFMLCFPAFRLMTRDFAGKLKARLASPAQSA